MKILSTIALIMITGVLNAQTQVNFKFYGSCSDSIQDFEYTMSNLEDSLFPSLMDSVSIIVEGVYLVDVFQEFGDYISTYSFTKLISPTESYNDTIELPSITVWFGSALNSKYMRFHNCDRICDGYEVAYYRSGQKWFDGEFIEGIPKNRIKYYDKNGDLMKIEVYDKRGFLKRTKYSNWKNIIKDN